MIDTYDTIEESGVFKLKTGDKLRLPIHMGWANSCQTIEFLMQKAETVDCKERIAEVPFADLVDFKCVNQGSFKIRVRNFDSTGTKQFAIYLGDSKLGRGFRAKANSLKEYVAKIVKHYQEHLQGWQVTARGSIVSFYQSSNCQNCGDTVEIKLGNYAILNQNSPCITSDYVGTEIVEGSKCYSLKISNIMQGNEITVNGRKYTVGERDTAETMRAKILSDNDFYCLRTSETLTYASVQGFRTVKNTNNPVLTALLNNSDSNYDYYLIKANDVREGNVFSVNGNQKIASNTDTSATIEAFYNTTSGFYRVEKGTGINPTAITGSRNIANVSAANVAFTLNSEVPTETKKKYTIGICEDVKGGNMYTLDGRVYIAKDGDTNLEVAYGLVGANNPIFTYYIATTRELETYADKGNRLDEQQLADVESLNETVSCCEKESMILEFEAKEAGVYFAEFKNDSGSIIRYSDRFCVKNMEEGEMVDFNNDNNAFGFDADAQEWFSVRLPIFLQDKTYPTYEEVHENTKGEQIRNVARIGVQRGLVTHLVNSQVHERILKVLKSKNIKIDEVGYTFIGEYSLPPHRSGIEDSRSAVGTLKENGLMYSLEGC